MFDSSLFLEILKTFAGKLGFKYKEYRTIQVTLGSGNKIKLKSPVFIKLKPSKQKRGRKSKRKEVTKHFALETLGFLSKKSPIFVSLCAQTSILCPSFETAERFLKNIGITVSQNILQRLTYTLGEYAFIDRNRIALDTKITEPGLRILVCIDGGRIRERIKKRGKRNNGLKRQGFSTDWKEPKLFTIHIVDQAGKVIRNINPLYDGTLKNADGMFELLEKYLREYNLAEAESVTFCCDGGAWIWNRIPVLAKKLKIKDYNEVLDYTHAKQNLREILDIVSANNGIAEKEFEKVFAELKTELWNGNIDKIRNYVCNKLKRKRGKQKALKKLNSYFKDHRKFHYSKFKEAGTPIGSGTVESAIRRVLNLRIKSPGIFWKRENAEKMIFLRSQLLSGRWNIMMQNIRCYTRKYLKLSKLTQYKNAA